MHAPRPRGTPPREVTIRGCVVPWRNGGPVVLEMTGTSDWFVPMFSTAEALKASMRMLDVDYQSIKQIDDGRQFLEGLAESETPQRLRPILDPVLGENNYMRWSEVFLES